MIVAEIIKAHQAGKIDLVEMRNDEIAKMFDCGTSSVSAARKKIGVKRPKTQWQRLLEFHDAGKVDIENWRYTEIRAVFACSYDTVLRAIEHAGLARNRHMIDALTKKDNAYARYQSWKFRKKWSILKKWGVIPERVGLTRNEWINEVRRGTFN